MESRVIGCCFETGRIVLVVCFKQKTAYEMLRSLVGSEMCIFFFRQKTAYEIWYGLVGSEVCIGDREHSFE